MNEEKPTIIRRFFAWILDSLLALVLVTGVIFFTWTPQQLAKNPAINTFLSTSKIVEIKGQEIQDTVLKLQSQLTPEELERVKLGFQETFQSVSSKNFPLKESDYQNAEAIFKKTMAQTMEELQTKDWKFANPDAAKTLVDFQKTISQTLSQVNFGDILLDLLPLALQLLLLPLLVYLVYFIPEAFMGASMGQMILGIKTGTSEGEKANIIMYFVRYILKHSGLLMVAAGIFWSLPLLAGSGAGVLLIMNLSLLSLLGPKRQALYETLSRTALWKKRILINKE